MSGDQTHQSQAGEGPGKAGRGVNLQDSFLNQVRRDAHEVKVALVDGTLIRGVVRGFDNFTLVLHVGGQQHLVYKHAIAQIVARRPQAQRREDNPPEAAQRAEAFNRIDLSGVPAAADAAQAEGAPAPSANVRE